jgi:hypothetical protein
MLACVLRRCSSKGFTTCATPSHDERALGHSFVIDLRIRVMRLFGFRRRRQPSTRERAMRRDVLAGHRSAGELPLCQGAQGKRKAARPEFSTR